MNTIKSAQLDVVPSPVASRAEYDESLDNPEGALSSTLTPAQLRHSLIAQAAYRRAERRSFAAGNELEDWLAAEAEIDLQAWLNNGSR